LPGWLAAVLAFVVVGGLVYGIISYSRSSRDGGKANKTAVAETEAPKIGDHPYSKYLELTGFRIGDGPGKKLQVQFVAVNHGAADMKDVTGTVVLRARGADAEDPPALTFNFKLANVPSFGVKDLTVTDFTQRRKLIDMPDWQFLIPEVTITSPTE
jgi:hypothetical protein